MSVFVDTSGLLALLDHQERNHAKAAEIWSRLVHHRTYLSTTSYVVLEAFALVQRRFGLVAVKRLHVDLMPVLHVRWVDESLHMAGVVFLQAANRRTLSLVDCVSLIAMQQLGINEAFAFDQHFTDYGFRLLI